MHKLYKTVVAAFVAITILFAAICHVFSEELLLLWSASNKSNDMSIVIQSSSMSPQFQQQTGATSMHEHSHKHFHNNHNVYVRYDLPKIVWLLWIQGWDKAPLLAKIVRYSWEYFNADRGWIIVAVDHTSLANFYLNESWTHYYQNRNVSIMKAAISDVARISLLQKYGGIWADATVFCVQPLDEWIWDYYNPHLDGFWGFDLRGRGNHNDKRGFQVASWFLAANKNSYVVNKWFNETQRYWQMYPNVEKREYFWFFYLFSAMHANDSKVASIWKRTRKLSADLPHFLQFNAKRHDVVTAQTVAHIKEKRSPVYKINGNRKWDPGWNTDTTTGYLIKHTWDLKPDIRISKMSDLLQKRFVLSSSEKAQYS